MVEPALSPPTFRPHGPQGVATALGGIGASLGGPPTRHEVSIDAIHVVEGTVAHGQVYALGSIGTEQSWPPKVGCEGCLCNGEGQVK